MLFMGDRSIQTSTYLHMKVWTHTAIYGCGLLYRRGTGGYPTQPKFELL